MSKFQLLSCDVALGGDILNVVARHAFNPVTFPELLALQFSHGAEAVTNVFDVGYVERDDADEANRLAETYGRALIREKMFPGAGTRLPHGDNRYKPRVVGTLANPGLVVAPAEPDLPPEPEAVPEAAPDYSALEPAADEYTAVEPGPAPAPRRRPVPVAPPPAA